MKGWGQKKKKNQIRVKKEKKNCSSQMRRRKINKMNEYETLTVDQIKEATNEYYREENEEDRSDRLVEYQRYIFDHTGGDHHGLSVSLPKEHSSNIDEYVREVESEILLRGGNSDSGCYASLDRIHEGLNQEILLGLSEHKDTSLVKRRYEHAPIPWYILDHISIQTKGRIDLDEIQETVLFHSSRGASVRKLMEDMLPFFLWKPSENNHDQEVIPSAFLSIYEKTKNMALSGGVYNSKQAKHIETVLYDNFMNYGNPLCPIRASKIDQHVKKEYGFRNHIFEEDSSRGIIVLSYSISDRYYIAIFLDANPKRIREGDRRVATLLFPSQKGKEKDSSTYFEAKKKRKRNDVATFFKRKEGSSSIVDNLSSSLAEKAIKSATKERKRKLLEKRISGVVEVVIYSCSCKRSLVYT